MQNLTLLLKKDIQFVSQRNGKVIARLLSFNNAHIQVKLCQNIETRNRTWFSGDTRLFDRDKIDGDIIEADYSEPVKAVKYRGRPKRKPFNGLLHPRKNKE